MAWRRLGDKPLSEPMIVSLLMHICVARPQWVNSIKSCKFIQALSMIVYACFLNHNSLRPKAAYMHGGVRAPLVWLIVRLASEPMYHTVGFISLTTASKRDHHLFRSWLVTCSPSHYLNQCWIDVNRTAGGQWLIFCQNDNITFSVIHRCVSKLGHCWYMYSIKYWHCVWSAPSHRHLNQYHHIVGQWTPRKWNLNATILIKEHPFENTVCKISGPPWVKYCLFRVHKMDGVPTPSQNKTRGLNNCTGKNMWLSNIQRTALFHDLTI